MLPHQADKAHSATLAAGYLLEHFQFTADSRGSHKAPGRERCRTLSHSYPKQTSTCHGTAVPAWGQLTALSSSANEEIRISL